VRNASEKCRDNATETKAGTLQAPNTACIVGFWVLGSRPKPLCPAFATSFLNLEFVGLSWHAQRSNDPHAVLLLQIPVLLS
jgi:hypothetical protein